MTGVGMIFRWYRRFPFLPDDAVAVLHGPAEIGSTGLTQALIDIRMTVRRAERLGLVDRKMRMKLERAAAALGSAILLFILRGDRGRWIHVWMPPGNASRFGQL